MINLLSRVTFILFFLSSIAYAAPNTTSTSGTISNGEAVTITGTGFGTKSTAAQILFEDFEDGVNGNSIGTSADWSTEGTAPQYNNDQNRTNSTLVARAILDGSPRDTFYREGMDFSSNRIYLNFWCYFQRGEGGDDDYQIKLFRIQDTNTTADYPSIANFNWGDDNSARWYYYQLTRDDGTGTSSGMSISPYTDGAWVNIEVLVEVESSVSASDGKITVNHGNTNQFVNSNVDMIRNSGQDFGAMRFGEFIGNTSSGTATEYFDDIYIDNNFARVFLGNADTFSGSSIKEIQPITSWSDTSIGITLNQGAFANNDNAWVYVCDSTDDCDTSGHAVTFGSGESGPSISNVTGGTLDNSESITVTGTDFGASQGTGDVFITDNNLTVSQTVDTWSDTSLGVTVVQGAFAAGATAELKVAENTPLTSSGFSVQFTPTAGFVPTGEVISGSGSITGGQLSISFVQRGGE